MKQIEHITVVGAGFMGTAIATIYAHLGYEVILHDNLPGALESFRARALPIAHSLATADDTAVSIVGRVRLVANLGEAVAKAQMVHEAIQEELPLKQALFGQLDKLCAPSVVLSSNTSSFLLTHMCRDVVHKDRVMGIHYVTPAHIVPVVELIIADFTPPERIAWARDFITGIGHVPVVCREKPGFLINRIQFAMLSEIHRIVDEGLATATDIDAAIRLSLGPRWALWGALACEDLVASKRTVLLMMEYMREQTGQEHFEPTEALRTLVREGKLGAIAGEGWCRWQQPYPEIVIERDRQLAEILAWLGSRSGASLLPKGEAS